MEERTQANLASLIDSSENYFWSVDLDGRLLTFNRAFSKHLEVSYGVRAAAGARLHELLSYPSLSHRSSMLADAGSVRRRTSPFRGTGFRLRFAPEWTNIPS
jgi:PAS domain-containing protein